MIFRKKKTAAEDAPGQATALPEDGELAKDTVATILRTLGKHCLSTNSISSEDFSIKCEQLALEVLIKSGDRTSGKPPRPPRKTYGEIRQLVREQRQAESKEYSAHRENAHIIVANLVSNLRKSLSKNKNNDQEIIALLSEMETVVRTGDVDTLRRIARKTSKRIRQVLSSQRKQEQQRLESVTNQLRKMREDLATARSQAERDPLTELLNRGVFDSTLQESAFYCEALGTPLTLYMVDIDHFKQINDDHGHQAGDQVLKSVSRELVRCFPRKDDIVARYGGEEFVALCKDVDGKDALMLAERARQAIEHLQIKTDECFLNVTVSIGVATLLTEEEAEDLLRRADEALYDAKHSGRNCVAEAL